MAMFEATPVTWGETYTRYEVTPATRGTTCNRYDVLCMTYAFTSRGKTSDLHGVTLTTRGQDLRPARVNPDYPESDMQPMMSLFSIGPAVTRPLTVELEVNGTPTCFRLILARQCRS